MIVSSGPIMGALCALLVFIGTPPLILIALQQGRGDGRAKANFFDFIQFLPLKIIVGKNFGRLLLS